MDSPEKQVCIFPLLIFFRVKRSDPRPPVLPTPLFSLRPRSAIYVFWAGGRRWGGGGWRGIGGWDGCKRTTGPPFGGYALVSGIKKAAKGGSYISGMSVGRRGVKTLSCVFLNSVLEEGGLCVGAVPCLSLIISVRAHGSDPATDQSFLSLVLSPDLPVPPHHRIYPNQWRPDVVVMWEESVPLHHPPYFPRDTPPLFQGGGWGDPSQPTKGTTVPPFGGWIWYLVFGDRKAPKRGSFVSRMSVGRRKLS